MTIKKSIKIITIAKLLSSFIESKTKDDQCSPLTVVKCQFKQQRTSKKGPVQLASFIASQRYM